MIYLIKKHDFDSLENSIGNARTEELKGYAESFDKAKEYIDKQKIHMYKGWDSQLYPYYTVEPVEKV